MQGEQTLYEVLGVSPDAPAEEIKKAHRKAMRVYHPDVYSGSREEAEQIAARINRAYATLSNPQERDSYDALLRGEQPASDPADENTEPPPFEDSWGEEADWEEIVDEEVVDEPSPEPEPVPQPAPGATPPAASAWQSAASSISEGDVRVTTPLTGLRAPLLVALGGITLGLLLSLVTPPLSGHPGTAVTGILAVLGAVLGVAVSVFLKKKGEEPSTLSRPLLYVIGVVALAVVVSAVLMGITALSAGLIAAASAFIGTHVLLRALAVRSLLDKSVKADSLRKNNTFGALPGGVGPDLLNRTLSALYAIPSVRMMRNADDDGLFSHAITNGHRVAFIKAITGFSGLYRWSGPSLLRDRSGTLGSSIPEEVLRATYREFSMSVEAKLPKDVEVDTWLFVYTQDGDHIVYPGGGGDGNPQVTAADVGLDQVGRFLIDGEAENPTVDQETFVKTFTALLG